MLNKIIDISLKNRLLVLLAAVGLMAGGAAVVNKMDVDVFPDLTAPTVTVLTEAHGMEAEEVERLVTFQVETGLNGSPNVRRIRSSSAAGISIVWVEFEWGTDIFRARQIVSEKLPAVLQKLPKGVGEPALAPISSIMGEIMLLAITSDSIGPMELRTIADWEILPRMKAIQGVANVIVIGGEFKQYQILASPKKMEYYGVSLNQLLNATEASNENATGGFYTEYGNQYVIKGEGRVYKLEDIANSFVKMVDGKPVRIGDVAEVRIGASDKIGDGSMNTSPAVIMTLTKQPGTNTLQLTEEIDNAITELKTSLPEGIEVNSRIFRQSDFIQTSIDNLKTTLLEGAFFVVVVLFLFLMNWRTTIISLLAIPLSLLVSIIVLDLLGYSINTMSLGGMAIAIGALVDDAIIDVENVFKRLRQNATLEKDKQRSVLLVVFEGSKEVRSSIIIATLIIIVSFIPLFFLSGMEGRLLQPLGIAFITSILTSLFVAVTVTPVLCSYLLSSEKLLLKQAKGTFTERLLQGRYRIMLEKIIRYPKSTIGVSVLGFAISMVLFFDLGRSFLPEFNEGSLVISEVGPPGMSLEESNKVGKLTEKILLSFEEISVVTRRTGRAERDEHAQGVHASEIDVPFALNERSKEEFLAEVREKLSIVPGVNITIGQPIAHRIDHMLSGTRANIAIKLFGPDLAKMFSLGNNIKRNIEGIRGLVDVAVEQQIEVPQIKITPKREMLARYGLTVADFTEFVDAAFAGEEVSQVYEGQRSFDMVVRFNEENRGSIDKMNAALIDLPNGSKIPLEQVALIQSSSSPNTINRENVQRKVVISANVSERDLRGVVEEIQEVIGANVSLPEGYRIEYGGQFESEERASTLLMWASLVAVLLIFVLLYYELKDARLAGIVLLNLPLALIGGVLIVYFTSGVISIASTIGFISLFGIATRNGILLISRYKALEIEGVSGLSTIIEGSIDRLNPILMTALTTALALIPLALKGGESGNEIQSPMAVVILGGLLTATVLNLFVIPCVYLLGRNK
ncbi:MAG: CusA/CzcA family heavy metal efflux RND transporter [Bacteroidetes bacterium]|nr:MAG: CusA/CzcA family heavy metal efflux RND transporter [Bacteroidota bacterium]